MHGFDCDTALGSGLVEAVEELGRIDGLNHLKQFAGDARFVRLQMADEVIAGGGERLERGMFFGEFLHIVFAELAQAGLISDSQALGREFFRDGEQGDGLDAGGR